MSKNIAIYTRVATMNEEDGSKFLSIQYEACEKFIRSFFSNCDWNEEDYEDIGLSADEVLSYRGTPLEEEVSQLNEMLYNVEEKEIDVIVVHRTDRLSRSVEDLKWIYSVADDHNVPIYEAETGKLLNLENKDLSAKITNAIANFELNHTKERIKSLFQYQINKADTKEMKEYLESLKEDFLLELE